MSTEVVNSAELTSMLAHITTSSAYDHNAIPDNPAEVVNKMVCVQKYLSDKYPIKKEESGKDELECTDASNALEESSFQLPKSMIAHLVSSFTETLKSAMVAHEVNKSVDKSMLAMVAHMPNIENENNDISAVSHQVIAARIKQRERSLSLESDTVLVNLEDDSDEDILYSSDDEWKYEKNSVVEMDYSKRTKTIRKHNLSTVRDIRNKERQIMEEILKKDIKNITEADDELCDLLSLREKGTNWIEKELEESVFLTEIKDSEVAKQQSNTIEVMDILEKEEGDYMKSSLTMKCNCSNLQKLSVCTCNGVDDEKQENDPEIIIKGKGVSTSIETGSCITKKSQTDLETECVPQDVVFPWNIKISNNWLEDGKLQDTEINSDGDLFLDLCNIKPGSYKYKFLINETSFCDETLPFEQNYFGSTNVFIVWSNNFDPVKAKRVTINAQITLPWKIKIIGNWSKEQKIIECQVCTNGDVAARLPPLLPGSYEYKFLINNCQFVDESLPFQNGYLSSCNLLLVKDNGKIVFDAYA